MSNNTLTAAAIAELVDGCLTLAVSQDKALGAKSAPIWQAVVAADMDDRAGMLTDIFRHARGPYLAMRATGNQTGATSLGKAWNRFRAALDAGFKSAGLKADWPNWRSGEGVCTMMTLPEAKQAAEQKRAVQAEEDAATLAKYQEEEARGKLEKLRAKSAEQLAADFIATMKAWGGNPLDVLAALQLELTPTPPPAKPAARKSNGASKPA